MVSLRRHGDEAPITPTPSGYRVDAESRWIVEGAKDEIDAIQVRLPEQVRDRVGDFLILTFVNTVGRFELPHLGTVDVHSGKWTERDFDRMLGDITDAVSALPFSAGTGAALPHERSVAAPEAVLFHMFAYLRYVLGDTAPESERLAPSLIQILADPHRRLEAERRQVPLDQAGRVDVRTVLGLSSGEGNLQPARGGGAPDLARLLNGHLPSEVNEGRLRSCYDVPENRFIKHVLDLMRSIVERTMELAGRLQSRWFADRLRSECAKITQTLGPIRRHRIWDEIGEMRQIPASSTVLQRRRGYREVLRHFVRIRLAPRIPLSQDDVRRLLELKDIARLYEVWCFFEVQRAVGEVLGPPSEAEGTNASDLEWTLPWDLRVRWAAGVELFYNLRFSQSRGGDRHSYSVPLRPDITLKTEAGPHAGVHLFDAKFRLDRVPGSHARDAEEDEELERRGTYKNADIYKMHTYRDAIPNARSVRILYPGDETAFYEEPTGASGLDGVGAVPCRPGHTAQLRDVMKTLLCFAPGRPVAGDEQSPSFPAGHPSERLTKATR